MVTLANLNLCYKFFSYVDVLQQSCLSDFEKATVSKKLGYFGVNYTNLFNSVKCLYFGSAITHFSLSNT